MKQNIVFFSIVSFFKEKATDLLKVILILKVSIRFGILVVLILTISDLASADVLVKKPVNPDPISKGLSHLLDVVKQDKPATFNPQLVGPVINFVASAKKPRVRLTIDTNNKAPGAYGEFFIKKSLKDMLQLVYHPRIPSFLFSPTSARVAYWKEIQGNKKSLPAIWKMMSTSNKPVVISGVEHEITAPDINSGAYYKYDQDRTLIFYRYKGSNVFMSLTKQLGVSEVGQKGLVLGADEEWNYFYSGQNGLTKMPVLGGGVKMPGLSKIESYMYDSYSILVYYEPDPGKLLVKCGVFKWVNAGWKNVNMVKEKHVYDGIMRYAKSFKSVIESPHLPSSSVIARVLLSIESQNLNSLRKKVHLYFEKLEKKCQEEGLEPGELFINLVKSDIYIKQMTKKELQSFLALEYMKDVLRKDQALDITKKGKLDSI
ncbi:MAG: hypothetical protein MUP22_04085 [Desulfobacterales bacterium]|nr:hypothetical protein [Desulfobacterales bacterium]